jgi:hypothetical protein
MSYNQQFKTVLHMWEDQIQSNPVLLVSNSICCSVPFTILFRVAQAQSWDLYLKLLMDEHCYNCRIGDDEKQT